MPLEIHPVSSASEAPTLALIHMHAFMLVRINQAMYPKGLTPAILSATESRHRDTLLADGTARYAKVIDTDRAGEQQEAEAAAAVIAFAEWHVFDTAEAEAARRDLGPKTWPADTAVALATEYWAHIVRARRSMQGVPHVFLSIIATEPGQGRRGAASLLMHWGVALADERGLPCFLESSPFGEGLYKRYGFVEEKDLSFEVEINVSGKEGEEEMYRHLVMVRPKRER